MTSPFRRAVSTCFIILGSAGAVSIVANHPAAHASDSDARSRGAIVFQAKGCERCHSITGVGGDRAPALSTVGWHRAPQQIMTQILQGGHGMPPFKGVLTNNEVKDLVAFLSSCQTESTPGCRRWQLAPSPQ
jgi:mono/diheme cytochrome c family protein